MYKGDRNSVPFCIFLTIYFMVKIKYKLKEMHIDDSDESTGYYTPMHRSGELDGTGVQQMNTMEECGMDEPPQEYGASVNGNPDQDGDGVYSPAELYYHFDLNQDGSVYPDEYEAHVKWHEEHPEVFQYDEEQLNEKKDRCYYQAKAKYDVFPSAYASGYIVRCRKGKIGRKKKVNEKWSDKYKRSIDCNNPKGFSQRAHCQGRKK